MALSTRLRVASDMRPRLRNTIDTVAVETFACAATSAKVIVLILSPVDADGYSKV
ncbi:hypothetical protein D3C80_2239510 [compost metagenome]